MHILKIIVIIVIAGLIGNTIFTWIIYFDLKEKGTEIVKCYDRYGNEIIGEECINENDDMGAAIILTILMLVALVISSGFLFVLNKI